MRQSSIDAPAAAVMTSTNCQTLGPDQHPWGLAFQDPPTHIQGQPIEPRIVHDTDRTNCQTNER